MCSAQTVYNLTTDNWCLVYGWSFTAAVGVGGSRGVGVCQHVKWKSVATHFKTSDLDSTFFLIYQLKIVNMKGL